MAVHSDLARHAWSQRAQEEARRWRSPSLGERRAAAAIVPPMAHGPFALTLRAYLPELDLLQGRYRLPPVEPIR
jgi:hypothetical protein